MYAVDAIAGDRCQRILQWPSAHYSHAVQSHRRAQTPPCLWVCTARSYLHLDRVEQATAAAGNALEPTFLWRWRLGVSDACGKLLLRPLSAFRIGVRYPTPHPLTMAAVSWLPRARYWAGSGPTTKRSQHRNARITNSSRKAIRCCCRAYLTQVRTYCSCTKCQA